MSTNSGSQAVVNQSGSVNIHAETVVVQGSVVGRDQISVSGQAGHAVDEVAQAQQFESQLNAYLRLLAESPFRFPMRTGLTTPLDAVTVEPRLSKSPGSLPNRLPTGERRPGWAVDEAFWDNLATRQLRLIIVGEMGSGKTFLSQLICHRLAARFLATTDGPIPLHVPLLDLATHWQQHAASNDHTTAIYILQFIAGFFQLGGKQTLSTDFWTHTLSQHDSLIIFDGLDEVPVAERGTLIELLKQFQAEYARLGTIITLRPHAYEVDLFDRDYRLTQLLPLKPEQQVEILQRLAQFEQAAPKPVDQGQNKLSLFQHLLTAPSLMHWLDKPLFLTAAYFQYEPEDCPLKSLETSVQHNLAKFALHSWDDAKVLPVRARQRAASASFATDEKTRADESERSRELLAFWGWQLSRDNKPDISIEAVADWWREVDPGSSPRQARQLTEATVQQIAQRSQLLAAFPLKMGFQHEADKTLFAGQYFSNSNKTWPQLVKYLPDPAFRSLLFTIHDLIALQDSQASGYRPAQLADEFLSFLLTQADQHTDRQAQAVLIQLIADCLLREVVDAPSFLQEAVISRILKIIEDRKQTVELGTRISLGRALGDLGDPRLEPEQLVFVPRGEFFMGFDLFPADRPARRVMVEDFRIDKYPVTHAQYQRFIEAGGYDDPQFWSPAGWDWVQHVKRDRPKYWDDPRFNAPNYPVVGVTWYEADAFARWAGKRLPTEKEWEKAARGSKYDAKTKRLSGQDWAWGNEFRSDYLNCAEGETAVEGTTPIGIYPAGASPYGVLDMCGNVSEWTADWYLPYAPSSDPDSHYGERFKVRRGGGWDADQDFVRCTCRIGSLPTADFAVIGFRCCTSDN